MILKGSSRGGAKQMAQHLLSEENDHVTVHEVSGFMADDVQGALQEIYAISKGTQCRKFLYSLSLNPPPNEVVKTEDFEAAIAQAEKALNLEGQSRVIVFHEKGGNGRNRHCHCVWSRIDTDQMKAIPMDFDRPKLQEVAKDLYIEHGWNMPKGFLGHAHSDPRNFTLKEWKQAERQGLNPKQIKATLQTCWQRSDNKKSFSSALTQNGFFLARGDRKNVHVAVDWNGEVYALRRALSVKVAELKQRLGEADKLPTIAATKAIIANAQSEAHTKLKAELALRHKAEATPLMKRKAALIKEQRIARAEQHKQHTKRQQQERDERQAQYRKGVKGLWDVVTGKYSKLKVQHKMNQFACDERDWDEKGQLIKGQIEVRQTLQTQLDITKARQQREAMALNADFVKTAHGQELPLKLNQDGQQKITPTMPTMEFH